MSVTSAALGSDLSQRICSVGLGADFSGFYVAVDFCTKLDTGVISFVLILSHIDVRHPESFSAILDADV